MATFTPPTHTEYMAPTGVDRLWSRVPYPRGDAVIMHDGIVLHTEVIDGDTLVAAHADPEGSYQVFHSGVTQAVHPDNDSLLASASLDSDLLLDEGYPAWLLS